MHWTIAKKLSTGFIGIIAHDESKPDGTPRKLMSADKIRALGWSPKIALQRGIEDTYQDFLATLAA